MANSTTVTYTFTGSSTQLQKAVAQSITALGQYQRAAGQSSTAATTIGKSMKSAASPFKLLGGAVGTLSRNLAALAGIPTSKLLAESVKQSIDYVEALNMFNVVLGDSVSQGREFVQMMQSQYGLDPSNMMRYTAVFYQLASAIGVADNEALKMSTGLVQVGLDLSSLFNMPIEQVMENLQSGMQGMTRAVRKYGIDIRVATLEAEALALGIDGSVLTMSEANRQGLRYLTVLKQTSSATGDFAKTIESPANQLRILGEQFTMLGRAAGNLLVGPFASILPYLNAIVMTLRVVLQGIGALLGFKAIDFGGQTQAAEDMADAFDDTASGIAAADAAAKALTAPFDELNVLQKEQAGAAGGIAVPTMGAMDPKLVAAIDEIEKKFDSVKMKATEMSDAILDFLGIDVTFDEEGNVEKFNFDLGTLLGNLGLLSPAFLIAAGAVVIFFAAWKLTGFLAFLGASGGAIAAFRNLAGAIWAATGATIANKAATVKATIVNAGQYVASVLAAAGALLKQAAAYVVLKVQQGITTALTAAAEVKNWLYLASIWAITAATTAWTAVTTALGAVMAFVTGPIGLAILAIAALIAIGVLLYKNWETVKEVVTDVWEGISLAVSSIVDALRLNIKNVINATIGIINKFIKFWNGMQLRVPEITIPFVGKVGGFTVGLPHVNEIPMLAAGGVVTGPTMAMVGEGGNPEAIIPLGSSPQMQELIRQISEAVSGTAAGDTVVNITTELDGDVIYRNQQRVARNRGIDFGMGVFAR